MHLRPTSSADEALISQWVAADSEHRTTSDKSFWLPQKNCECFAVEDENGPIFFVRAENLLRLHIQFAPREERARLAAAIDWFERFITSAAAQRGYKQIIFESTFAPLIRFLKKRGFRGSPDEIVKDIHGNPITTPDA